MLAGQLAWPGDSEATGPGHVPVRGDPAGTGEPRATGAGVGSASWPRRPPWSSRRHERGWLIAEPTSSGAPTAALENAGRDEPPPVAPSDARSARPPRPPVSAPPVRDAAVGSELSVGAIEVEDPTRSRAVRDRSRSRHLRGGGHRFLQVQWWVNGSWRAFPVPAKTDPSGEFTAYVELGRPNSYRLRVRDPQSGVTSEPFTLVIEDPAGA